MKSQYYYLVAGLPEISSDDTKANLSYVEYLQELMQAISRSDNALLSYFRMPYENRNLLAWQKNKDAELHPLGNLQAEDFQEQYQMIDYEDQPALPGVPPYFLDYLREKEAAVIAEGEDENRLTALYYDYAAHCPNTFVREWLAFEKNLRNVLTAINCRKYQMDILPHLVGEDELTQSLATSTARDFNISSMFPSMDAILRICEEDNLLEREKQIDRLQWNYLDELCTSCYFSIEVLLSYLVKLQSLERWIQLDPKAGEEKFRALIQSMKQEVEIPA